METYGARYTAPIEIKTIPLTSHKFSAIHQIIKNSDSMKDSCYMLQCNSSVELNKYLSHIRYQGKGLNWKKLRSLSEDEIRAELGSLYDQRIIPENISINQYAFSSIHELLKNNSLTKAAAFLNIESRELITHIATFPYKDNQYLSCEILKKMSVDEAINLWGNRYYLSWGEPQYLSLEQYRLCDIHAAKSRDLAHAAAELRVRYHSIRSYFSLHLTYEGKALSYKVLHDLSEEEAQNAFGEQYYAYFSPRKPQSNHADEMEGSSITENITKEIQSDLGSNFSQEYFPDIPGANVFDEEFLSGYTATDNITSVLGDLGSMTPDSFLSLLGSEIENHIQEIPSPPSNETTISSNSTPPNETKGNEPVSRQDHCQGVANTTSSLFSMAEWEKKRLLEYKKRNSQTTLAPPFFKPV